MKNKKVRKLIAQILAERPERPVTIRTLGIDFEDRTVYYGGRVLGPITVRGFDIPILDTSYPIIREGNDPRFPL